MFGPELLSGIPQAVAIVGVILAEAIALYVGYGALTQVVGRAVRRALRGN